MHTKRNMGIYKSERLLASALPHSQSRSYCDSKLRWGNTDFSFQTTDIKIRFMQTYVCLPSEEFKHSKIKQKQ